MGRSTGKVGKWSGGLGDLMGGWVDKEVGYLGGQEG